jgi:hypothetical protein
MGWGAAMGSYNEGERNPVNVLWPGFLWPSCERSVVFVAIVALVPPTRSGVGGRLFGLPPFLTEPLRRGFFLASFLTWTETNLAAARRRVDPGRDNPGSNRDRAR